MLDKKLFLQSIQNKVQTSNRNGEYVPHMRNETVLENLGNNSKSKSPDSKSTSIDSNKKSKSNSFKNIVEDIQSNAITLYNKTATINAPISGEIITRNQITSQPKTVSNLAVYKSAPRNNALTVQGSVNPTALANPTPSIARGVGPLNSGLSSNIFPKASSLGASSLGFEKPTEAKRVASENENEDVDGNDENNLPPISPISERKDEEESKKPRQKLPVTPQGTKIDLGLNILKTGKFESLPVAEPRPSFKPNMERSEIPGRGTHPFFQIPRNLAGEQRRSEIDR